MNQAVSTDHASADPLNHECIPQHEPGILSECPDCDYCLKGLPEESRCPECGFAFDRRTRRGLHLR